MAGSTRATRYGRDTSYFQTVAETLCLIVQVETEEALAEIPNIAAVDGVDGVFIGPSDLAASMGHIGNPGHGDVQAAIRAARDALQAAGTPAGILAVTPEDRARYIQMGFDFVAGGVDTGLLAKASDALAAEMRGLLPE